MRPSKPTGLAIVDAEVVILDLGEGHVSGRKPGRHAVVVMPQYPSSVASFGRLKMPQAVLAKQGARLEEALEYIHSLGLVHMDITGANILVDMSGQWALCDFGAVVRAGCHVKEVTQMFAPVAQLIGKPAKKQYDWHMLAVALAVWLHPDTWKDQLVVCSVDGMLAPLFKLEAAIETATDPELHELFKRILARAAKEPCGLEWLGSGKLWSVCLCAYVYVATLARVCGISALLCFSLPLHSPPLSLFRPPSLLSLALPAVSNP
mmetsp:Transcript_31602/g.94214  ORF Transcript_31602/g.94214 Transcript_31602/m.94214 type:complete len:263 (-) Transcript_31602:91-879(-)